MDTQMWIWVEIDDDILLLYVLDTHKRICHKTMIDTVLVESAEMI